MKVLVLSLSTARILVMQLPWPRSWQPASRRIKVLMLQLVQLALPLICSVLLAHSLSSTVDYVNANVDPKEGGEAPEVGGN